ncbi:MAG: beta-galactosidase, partial [Sulfuricellaceae bacterium]|nr:beta-galactosidase [Sulfuricellaceae bacterium]
STGAYTLSVPLITYGAKAYSASLKQQPGGGSLFSLANAGELAPPAVFALTDVGDSTAVLDSYAARATVDGLAFRTSWGILEPHDGVYDWTTLDAAFDTVRARGKQLTLHVGASSAGAPSWLAALGVATYTYSTPLGVAVMEALPWDATFLSRYTKFVAALAAHIQARGDGSLLYAVSDGVPVAEMSLVGCQNGSLSGGTPYSRASYLNAWKTTVAAYAAAFAGTRLFISAPVAVICMPDNDGKAFYTDIMDYAYAKSAKTTVFAADLNAAGSVRLAQVDAPVSARAAIAFQMIWSSTGDTQNRLGGTLKDAVCHGIGYGARYVELYKADISSTDAAIQDAIQSAHAGQPC